MEIVSKDVRKKTYDYFSRYSELDTYYNNIDKKRFYGTGNQLNKEIDSYIKHTVTVNDTLDTLSLKYYGNPLYWWIIADINNIQDPFNLKVGKILIVPYLNQVKFK